MPTRRRTGLWVALFVGAAAVGGGIWMKAPKPGRVAEPTVEVAVDETTPLSGLNGGLRDSDARALAMLFQKAATPPEKQAAPIPDAEAADWVEALKAVRTGYPKFGTFGRSSALKVVGQFFRRLAAEPAPATWADALAPAHDLLTAGLNDTSLDVRAEALAEVGGLWSWTPGRPLVEREELALADWRTGFHATVVRRLGDPEPRSRAAAVVCLGRLPVPSLASPAVAYLEDPKSPEVRKQVMISFAARRSLLSDDAVLRHMFDKEAGVGETAELVLKTRGLNQEQISLGSMIFHPKAEIRASVIPMLRSRTDIDPVTWLIQLTNDVEDSVRLGAVEALSSRPSPEAGKRLAELAANDPSEAVRRAAGRFLPDAETTAALPPLPGSPRLNPKAN